MLFFLYSQTQLDKKCHATKHNKIKGVPKLDDANNAGSKYSQECTLILTEGDSAKSLAVSGLGVVGRDRYGVFPLKGKLLNTREATHKQVSRQGTRAGNFGYFHSRDSKYFFGSSPGYPFC